MIETNTEFEQLIDAVICNDFEHVKFLLQKGIDPNGHLDEAKLRPLHFAAQNGSMESAELLITAGADVNAKTDEGESPLDIARMNSQQKFIELLLRYITG